MPRLALHWQIVLGMAVGAAVGVALNVMAGRATTEFVHDLPAGLSCITVTDAVGRTEIEVVQESGKREQLLVGSDVDGVGRRFDSVASLARELPEVAAIVERAAPAPANVWGARFQRVGNLFLRMLKMVAVPLVVASLLSGIMGLGGAASLGRMFARTLTYYLVTSMLAILTGLVAVNLLRPGLRGGPRVARAADDVGDAGGLADVLFAQIENLIPENPFAALVEPSFLSIIAFTLAFAIFALRVGGEVAARVRAAADAIFAVMMAMTHAIIRLAPSGVLFLVAATTATQGAAVFVTLSGYMLTVFVALVFHACITLPLILRLLARRSPWQFARAMSPALLTAFSSASSNGTLPLTLDCVETRAGVRNRVGSFVLPLAQQAVVCFTALLASVGAAGIPHAGLVMMAIILQAVGLPAESQGIILAVDRVLDMARTSVNVWSDACGAALVDAWEGLDDDPVDGRPAV